MHRVAGISPLVWTIRTEEIFVTGTGEFASCLVSGSGWYLAGIWLVSGWYLAGIWLTSGVASTHYVFTLFLDRDFWRSSQKSRSDVLRLVDR
jgi:hypothetical protein